MEGSAGSQSGNENGKSQGGNFRRCFSNVLNCTPLWRESKFWSQNAQDNFSVGALLEAECLKKRTPLWREASKGQHRTFGSCDVEKAHGVVERSTFRSQNAKKTQCRKTFGRRAVQKVHTVVARSTLRSQNVQSTPRSEHLWSWDVEKVHAVVARNTFRSQKCSKLTVPDHFWTLRYQKSARKYNYNYNCNYTTRHYATTTTKYNEPQLITTNYN